jgi:Na+/phosphate symporter
MGKMLPVFIILLALPLLAAGLILFLKRLRPASKLPLGFLLSGIAGSILTALVVLSAVTVPIAPYETKANAWQSIYGMVFLFLYMGFGLGGTLAAIAVSPFYFIKMIRK